MCLRQCLSIPGSKCRSPFVVYEMFTTPLSYGLVAYIVLRSKYCTTMIHNVCVLFEENAHSAYISNIIACFMLWCIYLWFIGSYVVRKINGVSWRVFD